MVSYNIHEGDLGRGKPGIATTKTHTRTETQRRKRMQNMFSNLQSLLPNSLDQRVDKSTTVEEAIKYIKTLETTLELLQENKQQTLNKPKPPSKQHLDLSLAINKPQFQTLPPTPLSCPTSIKFRTFVSNNVVMSVVGDDAQISLCYMQTDHQKAGLYVRVAYVLDKFKLDFITGRICAIGCLSTFIIHARASRCSNNPSGEEIKASEDVFKVAAEEIALLLA